MALSSAVKEQIAQWYKALQQQIPDFISRAPQRQMIAEVAKTLAGYIARSVSPNGGEEEPYESRDAYGSVRA